MDKIFPKNECIRKLLFNPNLEFSSYNRNNTRKKMPKPGISWENMYALTQQEMNVKFQLCSLEHPGMHIVLRLGQIYREPFMCD